MDLVMNELRAKNLNGATITNFEQIGNEVNVAFTIEGIEVQFSAASETQYTVTGIVYQGQTFNDPNTLAQYEAWAGYVAKEVFATVARHQAQQAPTPAPMPPAQPMPTMPQPGMPPAQPMPTMPQPGAPMPQPHAGGPPQLQVTQGTPTDIKIAEARAKQLGFDEASAIKDQEINTLKKKYLLWMILIVLILLGAFAGVWATLGPGFGFGDDQNDAGYEDIWGEPADLTDGEELVPTTYASVDVPFYFDGLRLTLTSDITWHEIENEESEHDGQTVFSVPVTIENVSPGERHFNMFAFTQFSPSGAQLPTIGWFFDTDVSFVELLEPEETVEAFLI